MADNQMTWLLNTIGLGGMPVQNYDVEYLTSCGGYAFTSVGGSTTLELLEAILERNSHKGEIALIVFGPKEQGIKKPFQLMNSQRFNNV